MISLALDHLLESTAFAVLMGLLTLGFTNNRAAVRYGLWFAASLKFLIPFSLIVAAGRALRWNTAPAVSLDLPRSVLDALPVVAAPAPVTAALARVVPAPVLEIPATIEHGASVPDLGAIVLAIWALGSAFLFCRWLIQWLHLRAALLASTPAPIDIAIPVRFSRTLFEPGLAGVLHPVLLLPDGIAAQLSPAQLALVIEHELCHWRRRDNLTAAIHMAATLVFWFHPLIWWIGARLVAERECACDENVLAACSNPKAYADSILEVCRFYVRSPLVCAPGVAGANLRDRIERIMKNVASIHLGPTKVALLTIVAASALLLPMASGLLTPMAVAAMTQPDPQPAIVPSKAALAPAILVRPVKVRLVRIAVRAPEGAVPRPVADTTPVADQSSAGEMVVASTAPQTETARPMPPVSSAAPEEIVITGKTIRDYVHTRNFVRSYTAPSDFLDQVARWQMPFCVNAGGLAPAYNAFITARIEDVAAQIGAPKIKDKPCTAYLNILFTDKPQELLDQIRTKSPNLLGVHYPALLKKLATVTHPIQAWYATGTRDNHGTWELDAYDGFSIPVYVVPGSHLRTGLTSEFAAVTIVADKTKIGDWEIGTIADYIAMTAFAREKTFGKCQQVPSIANALEDCSDGVKATALSEFDIAYLKAVYASAGDAPRALQESEISSTMLKILEKQVAGKKSAKDAIVK